MQDDREEKIRGEAWENAFQTYALSYIMSEKAKKLGKRRRLLTFLTFLSPLVVGAVALGYGQKDNTLKYALMAFIPLAISQVIFGLWSLVARWDEDFSYFVESSIANANLSDEFKECANIPQSDLVTLEKRISVTNARYGERGVQDKKIDLSNKDRNRGMRFALIKFQWPCAGCKEKPLSMSRTWCKICGDI